MDVSNMYVPDPEKWLKFYKDNTHHQNIRNRHQKGGSLVIGGQTEITPIEIKKNPTAKTEISNVPVKIVSPSQAVVDQAKTEINRKTKSKRLLKGKRKHKSRSRTGKRQRKKRTKLVKSKSLKAYKRKSKKKKHTDIFDKR